jgi:hypothetical protein
MEGQKPRILLVDDDERRLAQLREWIPEGFLCVTVSSAGALRGLLRRDKGRVYAGISSDLNLESDGDSRVTVIDALTCP